MKRIIKNVTKKDRYCEDKLVKSGEEFGTEEIKYIKNAKLSPEIFEIREDMVKKIIKPIKIKENIKGDK